ncbi:DnaB-like helicase C-terminal domain-containing protein [Streptomyces anulatus]|uniref:DnaB-like helicase C-terminal domain-containing protein n=1 Tax=Streptomyces anulatus TaxID=1892 RepID=UPI003650E0E8
MLTGLSDFDALAGPLPRGSVTAVAGRPSAGASAFVLSVARNALADGHAAAYINLQVGHETLLRNFLAAESSTNVDRVDTLNEGRLVRLKRASASLQKARLWTWTPDIQLRPEDMVQELHRMDSVDLIIVDDYALAAGADLKQGDTLAALRQIAADRDAVVLATAHLPRTEWGHEQTVPAFEDLTSGDEALAGTDTAIVLHRPDTDRTVPERRGEVDIIAVRGWRNTGAVTVRFEPEYHRLVDHPNGTRP